MRKPSVALIGNLGLLWILGSIGCAFASGPEPKEAADGAAVDHLMLGIADLEEGIRQLAKLTGVMPERGGEHPGRGTQNALLSLGPQLYVEIFAPVAGAGAGSFPKELMPIGWAIGTKDLDKTKGRLEAAGFQVTSSQKGSRVRPDGGRLEWHTAGLVGIPGAFNPFLIEWGAETVHPAKTSPKGCTLESMEIHGPQTEQVAKLVSELRLGMVVREGEDQDLVFTLMCPAGRVRLSRRAVGKP